MTRFQLNCCSQVLVQVYIPDSLTATEADHVIIGVSVSESVDLTSASFRSDLASKLATVYQNAKGKISSRRKKRSGSTSATVSFKSYHYNRIVEELCGDLNCSLKQ